ncbi:hypothetical protein MPSEU_000488400 [Mayamaea pseudoterrestris]|nr:hypothetical protein MPSEU_000488400 [Mayamaea pseudoterrestris]
MPPLRLDPYHGLFVHLLLLGIPYRFGLLPTGHGRSWLIPESMLDAPCTMFNEKDNCSALEIFCIRDFGMRFILHYELAWIVWFTMRRSPSTTVAFHKILLGTTTVCLLAIVGLQNHFHPAPASFQFNQRFFQESLIFHLLAIAVSVWAILTSPAPALPSMKWSIPGNAVFIGGLINAGIAVAAFQALWFQKDGIEHYYRSQQWFRGLSSLVRICFSLAAVHTVIHSVIMFRIRTFLNMPQLRTICLYKLLLNLVLPFIWFPELSPHTVVDQRTSFALRGSLIMTYLLGYVLAGKAEGISRILSSEKDD